MTRAKLIGLMAMAFVLIAPAAKTKVLCKGFLPENHLKIPISVRQIGGLTEADFNKVLDQVQAFYGPYIAAKGGNFVINRNWQDDTVNASAERQGNDWVINMYGGLARHPVMTKDGFTLVACHETGHHLGGTPKAGGWFGSDWASVEGEADYYATLDCMRNVFKPEDNAKFVQTQTIDPILKQKCEEIYNTQDEENLCMREGMAGLTAAMLFKDLNQDQVSPRFDTPDTHQVDSTDSSHPATQCRLDTYYQGGLCYHDISVDPSDTDPNIGACTAANGQKDGLRPRCWYSPNN